MQQYIDQALSEARLALDYLSSSPVLKSRIEEAATQIAATFRAGGRAYSCGNGGSMCDAMHFAEEMSGRFRKDRDPLPAMAIADPAYLSCTANDYSWEHVFSRFLQAHGRKGDVLLAISTSGKSGNVLAAAKLAQSLGMTVIGLSGRAESPLSACTDIEIPVGPAAFADRIQELHIKIIHIMIEIVERDLFPANYA